MNCAEFSGAESVLLLSRQKIRLVPKSPYLDPLRRLNFRCSRQARAGDDDFMVNFARDVKTRKKRMQEVKAAKLCQNRQRR